MFRLRREAPPEESTREVSPATEEVLDRVDALLARANEKIHEIRSGEPEEGRET